MDNLLELLEKVPLPAILLVVALTLLPCISKIVDSLCGFIFNLVLVIVTIIKWKDIRDGKIFIRSDFRGVKLEIGKVPSKEDESTSNGENNAKEETPSIGFGEKTIDLKKFSKGGQS